MMIRRSTVEQLHGFDEAYFLYYEETDFCLRAKRAGIETWYVPTSKVMHIAGQSTKVTERDNSPKRYPSYWYESKRRYFLKNHGLIFAILVDFAVIFSGLIDKIKLLVFKIPYEDIPFYLRDTLEQSPLYPRNREVLPFVSMLLPNNKLGSE